MKRRLEHTPSQDPLEVLNKLQGGLVFCIFSGTIIHIFPSTNKTLTSHRKGELDLLLHETARERSDRTQYIQTYVYLYKYTTLFVYFYTIYLC